jgi:transposase
MPMTYEQVLQISKGDSEIAAFIMSLLIKNAELEAQINGLESQVKELKRQLDSKSNNSSKPPSSDGFRKPKSQRTSGGKIGGKPGHDGTTLCMVTNPNSVKLHTPHTCEHCQASLESVVPFREECRQVFDIPPVQIDVTEHRVQSKVCPICNQINQGSFPTGVEAPTQYGERLKALVAYLSVYQMLPVERIQQLLNDLTGYSPSEATILSYLDKFNDAIIPMEATIREQLAQSEVLNTDETGARVEGKLHWIHSVSNEHWTLYSVHKKRGNPAMDAMNILPNYHGIVVHDCWVPYFKEHYQFEHALCGAHLLRECQGIIDYDQQSWAQAMQTLLKETWHKVKLARVNEPLLSEQERYQIEQTYDEIISQGETENVASPISTLPCQKKCGRQAKTKALNLLSRFAKYKQAILRFVHDPRVPFDNYQAERDIRMMKVKQKVSGTFRTKKGAEQFVRIRGFISTLRKQNHDVLLSLIDVSRQKFNFRCK